MNPTTDQYDNPVQRVADATGGLPPTGETLLIMLLVAVLILAVGFALRKLSQ